MVAARRGPLTTVGPAHSVAESMGAEHSSEWTGDVPRRVVVKFRDAVIVPYEDGAERHLTELGIGPWTELAQRFEGIQLDRLFTALSPERIGELVSEAVTHDRGYRAANLLSMFVIPCPAGTDPEALASAVREWPLVEMAYVDPLDESPAPGNNPRYPNQTYLKPPAIAPPPAPQGAIDAEFAWLQPGGTGTGQIIVDLERGATLDHQDLVARNIPLLHGKISAPDRPHGTRVLGVVAAVDNALGDVGIAYGVAGVAYTCQVLPNGTVDRPNAVLAAIQHLTQGGQDALGRVLLLEVQLNPLADLNGVIWNGMPMETVFADFQVIRLATALGIVVVEPTGNGRNNLDAFREAVTGKFILSRASPDFRDSGAIMVGGSTPTFPYQRSVVGAQGTSFGTRVDCFAWAGSVDTSDSDFFGATALYTGAFDGTSSAAAIVAGAALLVEGVAEASLGHRLGPGQMRALLSDPLLNTPSANPGLDLIGVMPNLRRILQDGLPVVPDVYIRDHVGDTGGVHAGAISMSPDVIVCPQPVIDPSVTFGPSTAGDLMLGPEATAGGDNYVYVRVWNRGGTAAVNVVATVFYSPVSTLLTPPWSYVGSAVIPSVPAGNILTVSPAIVWPAASVPPAGHYCFIALVGNAQDPPPDPAAFLNFDNYYRYIRTNNNITWRNFNVVPPPMPLLSGAPEDDPYAFEFLAPGAADSDRRFELAVSAWLPEGSRVWLEAPMALLRTADCAPPLVNRDDRRQTAQLRVSPYGHTSVGAMVFPAKSRATCRVVAEVPSRLRHRRGQIYVSQLYEGHEVGRVTWVIAPDR